MTNRPSTAKDHIKKDCKSIIKSDNIIAITRSDGTCAICAKNWKGIELLTKVSKWPFYDSWEVCSLPCGSVYLMEENNG